MKPFTDIETFRHLVGSVRRYCTERQKPLPVMNFKGHVKLHGTNAGVRVSLEGIQPQKRSDICSIGADNAGFAVFCHGKDGLFRTIAMDLNQNAPIDFTIFGEWCGGNIQNQGELAIRKLDKHLVIFGGYNHVDDKYVTVDEISERINTPFISFLNENAIWFINQIPAYNITIDFSKPEDYLLELEKFTLQVEQQCPWGAFRGVEGIGEGIVWHPSDPELAPITGLWFKTKGVKHAAKDPTKKGKGTNIQATPEKLETIRELVTAVLPEWRLAQGITVLKENNIPIVVSSTGEYLKWICQDVLKEESDVIAANGIEWKALSGFVTREARQYYMTAVQTEVFGNETPA